LRWKSVCCLADISLSLSCVSFCVLSLHRRNFGVYTEKITLRDLRICSQILHVWSWLWFIHRYMETRVGWNTRKVETLRSLSGRHVKVWSWCCCWFVVEVVVGLLLMMMLLLVTFCGFLSSQRCVQYRRWLEVWDNPMRRGMEIHNGRRFGDAFPVSSLCWAREWGFERHFICDVSILWFSSSASLNSWRTGKGLNISLSSLCHLFVISVISLPSLCHLCHHLLPLRFISIISSVVSLSLCLISTISPSSLSYFTSLSVLYLISIISLISSPSSLSLPKGAHICRSTHSQLSCVGPLGQEKTHASCLQPTGQS